MQPHGSHFCDLLRRGNGRYADQQANHQIGGKPPKDGAFHPTGIVVHAPRQLRHGEQRRQREHEHTEYAQRGAQAATQGKRAFRFCQGERRHDGQQYADSGYQPFLTHTDGAQSQHHGEGGNGKEQQLSRCRRNRQQGT